MEDDDVQRTIDEVTRVPLPEPELPFDGSITLPSGFVTDDGLIRDAEVRELNGEDEEALSKINRVKNPGKYITTGLLRGVVSIGELTPTDKIINSLALGDRDYLLLMIKRASYGDVITGKYTCLTCGLDNDVSVNLVEDIPIKFLEGEERTWEVPLKDGTTATVRLPNGYDQVQMSSSDNKTVAEFNTIFLANCIQRCGKYEVVTPDVVRNLGVKDRKTILEFLIDLQPGPQWNEIPKIACSGCGRETSIPTDIISDLFRA